MAALRCIVLSASFRLTCLQACVPSFWKKCNVHMCRVTWQTVYTLKGRRCLLWCIVSCGQHLSTPCKGINTEVKLLTQYAMRIGPGDHSIWSPNRGWILIWAIYVLTCIFTFLTRIPSQHLSRTFKFRLNLKTTRILVQDYSCPVKHLESCRH